jgi:hypothetical protein
MTQFSTNLPCFHFLYFQCLNYCFTAKKYQKKITKIVYTIPLGDSCGRDRMVVAFTITCAISAYHH